MPEMSETFFMVTPVAKRSKMKHFISYPVEITAKASLPSKKQFTPFSFFGF